jgi:hypothetical protein
MHRGLVFFSSNKEKLACDVFQKTLDSIKHLLPPALTKNHVFNESIETSSSSSLTTYLNKNDVKSLIRNVALTTINNLAVCMFHIGNIFESIDILENHIRINPYIFLHHSIVYNLITCYDVAYKPTRTNSKKQILTRLVQLYHPSRQ